MAALADATDTVAQTTAKDALLDGLADAGGFVGGALAGWQLGRLFGFDVMAPGEMTLQMAVGWGFLLAGLAAGKWLANNWRARRRAAHKD